MSLQKKMIRFKFALTSRKKAVDIVKSEMEKTLATVAALGTEGSAQACKVPPMLGVDRDMRNWSLFQILEHNTIVNNQMYKVAEALGHGREFRSDFNAKTDTIPSDTPNENEIAAFRISVERFLVMIDTLTDLRQTQRLRHPKIGRAHV